MKKLKYLKDDFTHRRLYASDINKQMQGIRDNVSKRAYIDLMEIRQTYAPILKETSQGKNKPIRVSVMTFREAFNQAKKHQGKNFRASEFTKDWYEEKLNSLVGDIKNAGRWTQKGEKDIQIEHMQKVIGEHGENIDYYKDYKKLKDAFERVQNSKASGLSHDESGGEYINALMKAYKDILEGR